LSPERIYILRMALTISSGSFSTALNGFVFIRDKQNNFGGWQNAFVISLQHSARPRSVKTNTEISTVYDLRRKPLTTT